jgi:elongation factor Ts
MEITTEIIKGLREETGVSVMQCKKALEEAGGDVEKAKVLLRKASAAIAAKKSDRELGSGVAAAYVHAGGSVVGGVVLSCETDFVAKNEEFPKLAYDIAMQVAAMNPTYLTRDEVKEEDIAAARSVFEDEAKDKPEEMRAKIVEGKLDSFLADKILLDQPFVKDQAKTVKQLITEATQKFGERIEVTKMTRLSVH